MPAWRALTGAQRGAYLYKAANVLVCRAATPDGYLEALGLRVEGPFRLIDLVGVRRHRRLGRRRRIQNLARLHASFYRHPFLTRTDKLRFLRTYLQWGLSGKGGWKGWWREVERATEAKAARNDRSDSFSAS